MPATIVQQRVRDYSTWKREYDAIKDIRLSSGEISDQVYRDENDPNKITVIMKWNTLTNARKYFSSPELVAFMSRGGVEGMSNIAYVNEG